jgi:hypothetical protein
MFLFFFPNFKKHWLCQKDPISLAIFIFTCVTHSLMLARVSRWRVSNLSLISFNLTIFIADLDRSKSSESFLCRNLFLISNIEGMKNRQKVIMYVCK